MHPFLEEKVELQKDNSYKRIMRGGKTEEVPIIMYLDKKVLPDSGLLQRLLDISRLSPVKKIVTFPDLGVKERLKLISGVAIATEGVFIPTLSYASNCGMSLLKTPLTMKDFNDRLLDLLFDRIRSAVPLSLSPKISSRELACILAEGSSWIMRKNDMDHSESRYIENNGNMFSSYKIDPELILRSMPKTSILAGIYNLGIHGGGRHFIDLLMVDKIIDPKACNAFGLSKNQILIMTHRGSGWLGMVIYRYYAHRSYRGNSPFILPLMLAEKIPFHFSTLNNLSDFKTRWRYYFSRQRFMPILTRSHEGERSLLAMNACMNYGYASGTAIAVKIRDCLRSIFKDRKINVSYVYDTSHSSIQKEIIDGQELWIHRNDVCKVLPPSRIPKDSVFKTTGYPIIKPGSDRSSSYICVGGEGALESLYSIEQGTAYNMQQPDAKREDSLNVSPEITRLYRYNLSMVEKLTHISDQAIEKTVEIAVANDLAKPIASLRPIAVLKR